MSTINLKSMTEQVSEARLARIMADEAAKEAKDQDIKKVKQTTRDLIKDMEAAALVGEEDVRRKLRNEIIVLNMRLVTTVLEKYGSFSQDKFQNGCVGLLKAAETFQNSKGVPFWNYACFCIETEVRLAYKISNSRMEGKNARFLDSLDAPATTADGDEIDKHNMIPDETSTYDFDAIIEQAAMDTLFYDIIIPSIEEYGTRTKGIDMALWKQLQLQYFIELSLENSQQQRLTFTEMALQLGTTTQNLRIRHKKVVAAVKARCQHYGYSVDTRHGRARITKDERRLS